MKVLWFSNCVLGNSVSDGSGSWLHAMCQLIKDSVVLTNVAVAPVNEVTYNTCDSFNEVLVPPFNCNNKRFSREEVSDRIQGIIENVNPDIIHIWGTEGCWSKLFEMGIINGRVILEIQGLMEPISDVFWGGLNSFDVKRKSLCLRNLVYPSQGYHHRIKMFKQNAEKQKNILNKVQYVSTQSKWVRDNTQFYLPETCMVYKTLRPIRQEFWDAEPWAEKNRDTIKIFTSMSYYDPFKGMHILASAVNLLKRKYTNVTLEIAGVSKKDLVWYRQFDGIKYLKTLSKKLGVWENIEFVGKLTAQELTKYLGDCDVFVNPSFVESYSASTAEALAIGVPTVVAYAGAMPDFSEELPVSLFYSPMDYTECAAQIMRIKENKEVRDSLICNAKKIIRAKCGNENVKKMQLSIYSALLNND